MKRNNPSPRYLGTSLEKGRNRKAFTLVELIVVITILAILGTIAFISLQGYSRDARDSTRIADINSIYTQLELFVVKAGTLPIPDNNVELISSGTTIGYQGYAGQNILNILKVNNGGFDPVDQSPYVYRINGNKNTYQIMGFLENGNQVAYQVPSPIRRGLGGGFQELGRGLFPQANAATNLSSRFPYIKGKVLGILLEQTTNTPIQDTTTSGSIDLRTNTGQVDMYLTNTIKKSGTGSQFFGEMEFLAKSQRFDKPERKCPKGFIPVPGNMDFGQPAFCVAKYEMTYEDANTPNTLIGGTDWNTVNYIPGKIPVSMVGKFPIANITQGQAISACKSIGAGYHLITNNEWMSIARNIEQQPVNWSGGVVGSGFIYNGVSSDLTIGCTGIGYGPRTYATVTGDLNCIGQRNRLTLSNGEKIWDLAGNVREHVNKANTIDGIGYANGINSNLGLINNTWNEWNTITTSNRLLYGPLFSLNSTNGIGKIFQSNGNIFSRGGPVNYGNKAGIFLLSLHLDLNTISIDAGFRCAR